MILILILLLIQDLLLPVSQAPFCQITFYVESKSFSSSGLEASKKSCMKGLAGNLYGGKSQVNVHG